MSPRSIPHMVLVIVGIWLMAAPAVLDYVDTPAATSDRIVGPAVAAIGFLSIFAITRLLRWVNLVPGAWLLIVPWVVDSPVAVTVSQLLCGAAVLALAPLGKIDQSRYGGGWLTLVRPDRLPR